TPSRRTGISCIRESSPRWRRSGSAAWGSSASAASPAQSREEGKCSWRCGRRPEGPRSRLRDAALHQHQNLLAAVATVIAATAAGTATPSTRALRFAQFRILLLLFLGYASCYFCRSNLSVATPLL